MTLGAPISSDDDEPIGPAFTPDEVWSIDTKMDDGAPGRGNVMVIHWQDCTDATVGTDYAIATYDIGNKTIACAINFLNVY